MDLSHQVGEVGVGGVGVDGRLVFAVGLDGLSKQGDFSDAALGVRFDLAGDLVDWAGAFSSSSEGDDAVGTELVATFDHRDVCGWLRFDREDLRPELAAVVFRLGDGGQVEEVDDLVETLGLGPGVDEGESLDDGVVSARGVRSDHATHDGDAEIGIGSLEVLERAELGLGLVLGVLTHGAGVEHDQVGVARLIGRVHAEASETGRELGGVGRVDLATDGPDVVLRHRLLAWLPDYGTGGG